MTERDANRDLQESPSEQKSLVLDETLFMQTRLFSMFCERHSSIAPSKMDEIFVECGIWDFIKEGYEGLHTEGDEAIYCEIIEIINSRGVKI